MIRINHGCGPVRPEGWINTDSSINSLLQQTTAGKFIANFLTPIKYTSVNAKYMNLNKRWKPFKNESVDIIYASHLLEHLSSKSTDIFFLEAQRCLKKGGVIRIVVPDLYQHVEQYLIQYQNYSTEASETFLYKLNLLKEYQYPKEELLSNILGYIQGWPHQHKTMFDRLSLTFLLEKYDFKEILQSDYGESEYIKDIKDVEGGIKGHSYSLYLEGKK